MQKTKWILAGACGVVMALLLIAAASPSRTKGSIIVQDGDTEPTCAVATGDGDLCVADAIEANGALDIAGAASFASTLSCTGEFSAVGGIDLADDADIDLGTGDDFLLTFDATVQAPDSAVIGVGTESRQLILIETADAGVDLTIAQQTNPTLLIHSADSADALDYITFAMDQTDGVIDVGQGAIKLADDVKVTGETLTESGATDYAIYVTQTLNDTGAPDAAEDYTAIKVDLTATDLTGWATTNLMDLQVGSASKFSVDTDGDVVTAATLGVVSQTIGIPFSAFRVFDNTAALLPVAGATDDLGQVNGTLGTNAPSLQTEDLSEEGGNPTLNKAYFEFVLPPSYVAGSTVSLRLHAGMLTTVADDTATLDAACWTPDYANDDGTVSTDLVAEAAQSINNLVLADKTFTIDDDLAGHVFAPGTLVQCLLTTSVSDGVAGTAVIAIIRKVDILIST